ncbi:MAG: response regulator transcription factor [Cyanobacteria bacterium REEB67]|nr:response regulator transcription factor [Cyanobacteria bacterium REEB67]
MSAGSQVSVLIVDDQPIIRSALKMSLTELDHINIVGAVGDGRSAIKEAARLCPHVILMDVGLPGMDGIQASLTIKQELPDTRIIIFTSRDCADDISTALGAGADGYCLKHASTKRLACAIDSVIRGELWIDPELAETAVRRQKSTTDEQSKLEEFDSTETKILALIAAGMEVTEIAAELKMTSQAVSATLRQIIIRHSRDFLS